MVLFISAISLSLQILLDNVIRQIQWRAIQPPRYADISRLQHGFDMVTLPQSVSPLFVCLQCHKYIMNLGSLSRAIHPSSKPLQFAHVYTLQEREREKEKKPRHAAGIIIVNPIFFIAT